MLKDILQSENLSSTTSKIISALVEVQEKLFIVNVRIFC
jgi:hypothetical protein